MGIRFDDIDAINAAISDDYGEWGPEFEMTQDKVNQFAELTGDHQWIHVDIERAKAGPFGGPIAHGFFTLSLMASIVKLPADFEGVSNGVNYGANKLRFLSPVPVPSTLHAKSRLLRAEKKGPGTLLTSEAVIHVVGNDKPAVLYEMLSLLM
jgi:acyl dehydratase